MLAFLATTLVAYILYLILTMFSGSFGLWSLGELIAGAVLSLIAGAVAFRVAFAKERAGEANIFRIFNPVRFIIFLVYLIGPFFFSMAKSNFDVAYRVITGKIRPGIVRISPGLKTDLGITLLANSITLTPGTLSVDVDEKNGDLYVHWINVKNPEPSPAEVCGSFPDWVRRIAE